MALPPPQCLHPLQHRYSYPPYRCSYTHQYTITKITFLRENSTLADTDLDDSLQLLFEWCYSVCKLFPQFCYVTLACPECLVQLPVRRERVWGSGEVRVRRKKKCYHMLASFRGPPLQREDWYYLCMCVISQSFKGIWQYITTCRYMFHVVINRNGFFDKWFTVCYGYFVLHFLYERIVFKLQRERCISVATNCWSPFHMKHCL